MLGYRVKGFMECVDVWVNEVKAWSEVGSNGRGISDLASWIPDL